MGTFRGLIAADIVDFRAKNQLAHNTLVNLPGYTSTTYAGEVDIWSIDNKPILVELEQFSSELLAGGLLFQDLDINIIKIEELP